MRIINTLTQVRTLFPGGEFSCETWRHYAEQIMPELPGMCEADAAVYDFGRDVLPVITAALGDDEALNVLADSFKAVVSALRENLSALYDAEPDVTIALYLGLCNAAGWALRRAEHPQGGQAVLLGIEKIIELRWHGEQDMKGLLFHELGHLWHESAGRRELPEATEYERSVTQLYDEGIAMRCEQLFCGDDGFFHQDKNGWLAWCKEHIGAMRADYLRRMEVGESTRCFFGDWSRWYGHGDVGYYLGCAFIASLERMHSLADIACMPYERISAELQAYLMQKA